MQKSKYLETALTAVKKAEEIILHYYSQNLKPDFKSDHTPVTKADKEAEKVIIETIKSQFPDHGFLGEESGFYHEKSEFVWIIDPLDGTKNFVRKIPLVATEIALMQNNELILGISNAPLFHELMYAEKGQGAYMNAKKMNVSKVDNLNQAFLSYGNLRYFKESNLHNNVLSLVDKVQQSRGFGDFWPHHLIARGAIEIMIDAKTKIWDNAALKVIIEEAGGLITDIKGQPVDINTTTIIATNKILHKEVLKFF